jgi:uncharacterized protein YndB with AHSA1/START domain
MRRWWHTECDWETSEAAVDLRVGGAVRAVVRYPMRRRVRQQRYVPRSRGLHAATPAARRRGHGCC